MYIYFNQSQQIMQNCGFYVPSGQNYLPVTLRKVHNVESDGQTVTFNTYCAHSYPIHLKNVVVTAQTIV